jgi:5-formyltetrahydrofolate cyclo-ligase
MDKSTLRAQCRAWRDALTSVAVALASARICERLAAWPALQQTRTMMAYMAFGNEISVGSLMDRLPEKRWVIPRTLSKPEPHIILHRYDPARLVRHRFGMLEPAPASPSVEPGELDLVLVPGIAYDRRGYRLGFGGGFYDRFLPQVNAIKVGIAYAELVIDHVPNDEFDQRVDWIACETGILPATA